MLLSLSTSQLYRSVNMQKKIMGRNFSQPNLVLLSLKATTAWDISSTSQTCAVKWKRNAIKLLLVESLRTRLWGLSSPRCANAFSEQVPRHTSWTLLWREISVALVRQIMLQLHFNRISAYVATAMVFWISSKGEAGSNSSAIRMQEPQPRFCTVLPVPQASSYQEALQARWWIHRIEIIHSVVRSANFKLYELVRVMATLATVTRPARSVMPMLLPILVVPQHLVTFDVSTAPIRRALCLEVQPEAMSMYIHVRSAPKSVVTAKSG
mmetsp:Transcript_3187/g.6905  ORF Transcript_3187/g.6905 Transcript_3187/m.6905 type:complete len:267 (-) Transcript_3187:598-1398(-)